MCASVLVCAHRVSAVSHRGQKMGLGILELELQVVMSHMMWVLRAKPRSPERAVDILY